MVIMGFGDVQVGWQQEDGFLQDQKHQGFMRAALDMVYQGKVPNMKIAD